MNFQTLLFDVQDGVARITLNRPDRLNSFTAQMHEELRDALEAIEKGIEEHSVRVVVLTGAGRGFCAGQDLSDRAVAPGTERADLGESVRLYYAPLVKRIRALKAPVLAAVNGVAAGAGANLALACDLVVAARSASFIQAFCKLGLLPDTGGTHFLPRLVGEARAMGLALLGDKLTAERAESWGLIWQCIDDEHFAAEVAALAERLARSPTQGLVRTKQALQASLASTLEEQLEMERIAMSDLGFTSDYQEGVAAFLAKREPRFTGA